MVPKYLGTEVSVKPAKAVRVRIVAPHLGWQPSRDTETDVLYYDECNKIYIVCVGVCPIYRYDTARVHLEVSVDVDQISVDQLPGNSSVILSSIILHVFHVV